MTCASISYKEAPVSDRVCTCNGNTEIKCFICCFSSLELSYTTNKKSLLKLSFKGYSEKFIQMGKDTFFPPYVHNKSASLLLDILPSIERKPLANIIQLHWMTSRRHKRHPEIVPGIWLLTSLESLWHRVTLMCLRGSRNNSIYLLCLGWLWAVKTQSHLEMPGNENKTKIVCSIWRKTLFHRSSIFIDNHLETVLAVNFYSHNLGSASVDKWLRDIFP